MTVKHEKPFKAPALVVGLSADHAGFELKQALAEGLRQHGYPLKDFGAAALDPQDDYPDYVIRLAEAVRSSAIDRGVAVCGSGVGACIVANKVPGVRAALVQDEWTARQAVEDDDANVIRLGARTLNAPPAMELVEEFLAARFSGDEQHVRRLEKVAALERKGSNA
jgi:ribose 5-phosphate isomerase B